MAYTATKNPLRSRAARQLSNYQGKANYAYVVDVIEYESKSGFLSLLPTSAKERELLRAQQQQLRHALETLGFHIPAAGYLTGKVTKQQIKDFLLQLCSAVFPSDVGCVLIVFSGHGLEGSFYTSDGHPFSAETIKYSLASNESLREKAKWIIFGSCPGDSDHTTGNTTYNVADAAWWRLTSVHIMRDIVSTFAATDHYSKFGRGFFHSFVRVVNGLVETGRNSIELAELVRMLCREVSDIVSVNNKQGDAMNFRILAYDFIFQKLMEKPAEVTMSLVAQLQLPVNGSSTTWEFVDDPLAVTASERNERLHRLGKLGLARMSAAENWEFRCLSAGMANSAVLISILNKEAEHANVTAQLGLSHFNVPRARKMKPRRRTVSCSAELLRFSE